MAELREEFIVCHAPTHPDPASPCPQTLEAARQFVRDYGGQIKRRVVSEWEPVDSTPQTVSASPDSMSTAA